MRIRFLAAAVSLAVAATATGVWVSALGEDTSVEDASNESPTPSRQPCELLGQPAEVVSEPDIAEASESESDLALDLNSDSREAVRVTIRFDGQVALDVRTPARPEECVHSPVYSHEFRLSGDEVKVTATTDQGQYRSMTVPLSGPKRWVAVMLQDGLPLKILVFDEEVSWG